MGRKRAEVANPIIEIRERLGMNRRQMALRADVDTQLLAKFELGLAPRFTPQIRAVLEQEGVDPDRAEAQYLIWREGRRAALLACA